MDSLQVLAQEYLQSAGFALLDLRDGFAVADKLGFGGDRDTRLLWVFPRDVSVHAIPEEERRLLHEFEETISQYPQAKCTLLSHTLEGFSNDFRREAKRLRVKLAVPIQFFDAPFRIEEAPQHASAISDLRERGASLKRVPQPYQIVEGGEAKGEGADLLSPLYDHVKGLGKAGLHVVVGAAGMGKSVLFECLFSRGYAQFLDAKRGLRAAARPLPLIPEHLRGTQALRVRDLVDSFLRTDVAAPVPPDTLEWMVVNGFATPMFDGLDELYVGDPDFYMYLVDLLTRPCSQARILLFARDSLLTSCQAFANFLEDFPPGGESGITIYRLKDWDHSSKRAFAWLSFEGHFPEEGASDPAPVSQFLMACGQSEALRALSSFPYYCSLLVDEFKKGGVSDFADDCALVDRAVSGIVAREVHKGLLREDDLVPGGLSEWLETLALDLYEQDFRGLLTDDLAEYAQLVLKGNLTEGRRQETILTLVRFPLLSGGSKSGLITFKHELIAEYLAARHLLRHVTSRPAWVAQRLGQRIDLADSLIARYIARQLPQVPGGVDAFVESLRTGGLTDDVFRNLLQILLLALPRRDVIRTHGIVLEGRNLSHTKFIEKDLMDLSLRRCDLTEVTFKGCDMRRARLEGANLVGTRFERLLRGGLDGAVFGAFDRFEHIYVDKRRIEDRREFATWVREVTGAEEEVEGPCEAALQLRQLFLKFVHPDGTGRREQVPEQALVRGRRVAGAPSPEDCVSACQRAGYLDAPDFRGRIGRCRGDLYGDIIGFVTEWRLTPHLRSVLNALCRRSGCQHVSGLRRT